MGIWVWLRAIRVLAEYHICRDQVELEGDTLFEALYCLVDSARERMHVVLLVDAQRYL